MDSPSPYARCQLLCQVVLCHLAQGRLDKGTIKWTLKRRNVSSQRQVVDPLQIVLAGFGTLYWRKDAALCDSARGLSRDQPPVFLATANPSGRQIHKSFLEPGLCVLLRLHFRKRVHTELFFQNGLWSTATFHSI